jgi:hypothetical protein
MGGIGKHLDDTLSKAEGSNKASKVNSCGLLAERVQDSMKQGHRAGRDGWAETRDTVQRQRKLHLTLPFFWIFITWR